MGKPIDANVMVKQMNDPEYLKGQVEKWRQAYLEMKRALLRARLEQFELREMLDDAMSLLAEVKTNG